LRTLEIERFDNASLRGALSEVRSSHEALRTDFQRSRRSHPSWKATTTGSIAIWLGAATTQELEGDKAKLGNELATLRVAIASLDKQLGEETNSGRTLGDEKRLLLERADIADKRIVESEAAATLAARSWRSWKMKKNRYRPRSTRLWRKLAHIAPCRRDRECAVRRTRAAAADGSNLAAAEEERKKLSAAGDEAMSGASPRFTPSP